MSSVNICQLSGLAEAVPNDIDHLIVSASYEERAHGVWERMRTKISGKKYVCFNANHETYLKHSLKRFCDEDRALQAVELNSDYPYVTFEAIRSVIEDLRSGGACHLAVDLTGFTREALAILLYLSKYRLAPGSRFTAFYHRAAKYGLTLKKGWLSQGIREVRSVLGYAGQMRLSSNTHLMMIAGYETERAQEIIDDIQPSHLSMGIRGATQTTAESGNPHNEDLAHFISRVRSYYPCPRVDEFEFSTSDPIFTRDSILSVAKASQRNVVLSCLNSKPAMVGACLAAMDFPMIQIVYAQPLYYNTANYSEPSGNVLYFPVPL